MGQKYVAMSHFMNKFFIVSTLVCFSHTGSLLATTSTPAKANGSNDTIKKVVSSIFGFKDDEPAATTTAPAPAAAPAAPAAPAANTPPPAAVAQQPAPQVEPDFSKIADPMLRACATDFHRDLKKCASGGSCEYNAQNSFKGCVRPVIARRILKQHTPLFDEAHSEFLKQPLFRSCVDKFWGYVARCLGDKRCEEVLYYSLHNDCGKRLYNTGFVAGRSAALENSFISNKGASSDVPPTADEGVPPPPPAEDNIDVEAPPQ